MNTIPTIEVPAIHPRQGELTLVSKLSPPRHLHLRVSAHGRLTASAYIVGTKSYHAQSIAYCNEKIADCYLHDCNLWIGHAAFDVSPTEAEQIRVMFEPMGLTIETSGVTP